MLRKMLCLLVLLGFAVSAFAKDKYQQPGPVRLDRDGEKWAEKALKKLSLEEKVGQMLMIWARAEFVNLNSPDYLRLRDTLQKYHLGGFGLTIPVQGPFLFKSQPYEAAALVNQLQRDSELPLIFAADFERGLGMRLNGTTFFPHAMAFAATGKPEYAEAMGRVTAEEARAIGVEWNFFPIADVNSAPDNPIINTRAFGEDAQQVGDLAAAYIKGARAAGMLTTAKHFPGHGDTDTDSHLGLARVSGDRDRLDIIELPPFRRAIQAGVDAVMVAHVTVPALDPDTEHVASTSPAIVTHLLQHDLGFQGIVVTDAFDMNGLMRLYANRGGSARAAVDAVKAGDDVILIPQDLDAAYNGILTAVRSGEIPESRIDVSVLKILQAKASVGLHKARLVDLESLPKVVGKPENLALAQQVADEAVTLVRDDRHMLPISPSVSVAGNQNPYTRVVETNSRVLAVIFSDDVRSESGRMFERQLRARVPDANIVYVDPGNAALSTQPILATVARAQSVIAAVYTIPTSGKTVWVNGILKNTVSLADAPAALLRAILDQAAGRTAVVALGNPYLAGEYPAIRTYLCTFSNAPVAEVTAVRALFGEIAIRGKLPVTIPGVAQRGAGIERLAARPTSATR
ncbi:MAG: glycoside hydrolase family 3 protein [Terriglobales bacterium]